MPAPDNPSGKRANEPAMYFREAYEVAPSHPRAAQWQQATKSKVQRGELAVRLLASELKNVKDKIVLDIGAGEGGASLALAAAGARVIALEPSIKRITNFLGEAEAAGVCLVAAAGEAIPVADESIDAAVLQDVLEHCADKEAVLKEIARVLKPRGVLYLSTPNRFSILNFLSDPHWGVPFVSVMSRGKVNFLITKIFRREKAYRSDAAELVSLRELKRLAEAAGFEMKLVHRKVMLELFEFPDSLVWAAWQQKCVEMMRRWRMKNVLVGLTTDNLAALSNHIVAPTFYAMLRKNQGEFSEMNVSIAR